jgi:hypothetical protein
MKATFLLLFAAVLNTAAQYSINWSTLGGGGPSSGGAYTLSGTFGQAGAGTSTGGSYTLHGGFWSAFAVVQTEGAPVLRIVHSGTKVILAWPNPSTGFQLQESPSLVAPNWTDVNAVPDVVGDETQVSVPSQPGARFFRLRKP